MTEPRRHGRAIPWLLVLAACGRSGDAKPEHHTEEPAVGRFTMTLTPAKAPVAGQPIDLTLELRDPSGKRVTELDIAHEKLLHLIVVSADLGFFTHEHPERRPDGLLHHVLTLPQPGDYTFYADFTPTGGKNTVVSAPLPIAGTAPAPVALAPVTLPATAEDAGFSVQLSVDNPIVAGGSAMLDFAVRDANGDVTDLRPYLGAKGHCVIISADRAQYLHSHPMGGEGATVAFHTVFPTPGTYRVWVELRPRGEPLRVSFTVAVPAAADSKQMPMAEHEHPPDHHH